MAYRILTLNEISSRGLARLPRERYEVGAKVTNPDAILVRSADLHDFAIPPGVRAIGRAGAGVNNIPIDQMSRRGIPVFNTPGANANAVKELVLAGLLLAARNIGPAWLFVRALEGDDAAIEAAVEKGKKSFLGFELPGRTLGVVGLGAVGVEVANSALARSEEHTSELQSRRDLVCRLLLEKKKKNKDLHQKQKLIKDQINYIVCYDQQYKLAA